MENELFFLFTCVKNGRKFISNLFDSILNQTRKNFIHYIYEDGSDDPIEDLVEEYKAKAARLSTPFKIFYEKNDINIGLNMATKHCIDKCCAPYFIWIDCDNWVDCNFFKELEKTVKKNPEAIVVRTKKVFFDNSDKHHFAKIKNINNKRNDLLILMDKYYYSFFAVNYNLYKEIDKSNFIINQRNFFNDTQILFKCSLSNRKFVFSKKALGYMLIRNDSEYNKFIDSDYLAKEQLFMEHVLNLGITLNYNIGDLLLARNCVEQIKINNIEKKFRDNFSLLKKKRKLLKKNDVNFSYGEIYCSDFVSFAIYAIRCFLSKL